jgi:hypothetical protein
MYAGIFPIISAEEAASGAPEILEKICGEFGGGPQSGTTLKKPLSCAET